MVLVLMAWTSASHVTGQQGDDTADRAASTIQMSEFQQLYAREAVVVVDVRDEASFAHGRIAGAIRVPPEDVPARVLDLRQLASSRLVVTYCSCPHEATSLRVARALTALGVPAKALVGGYHGWVAAGGRTARTRQGR